MRIYLLIVGMALVTVIPRLLPFITLKIDKIPSLFRIFLSYIPFAAMGALIIPGIGDSIPESTTAALGGAIAATCIALSTRNLLLTIGGGVFTAALFLLF